METPKKPAGEASRITTLQGLNILDTLPEERFDRLTRLAKRLFDVPIALVSLVDENRQWFKSCQGLDVSETSRDISFCGHAILGSDVFVIPDACEDERFRDNPLVVNEPHIRFYAGCPLTMSNGAKVGTLCIIDREPRQLDAEDLALLRDLASMVEQELTALQLATMDRLTQISNRHGFEALSSHALALCRRLDRPASLVFVDLDLFKQINDRWGHAEGDRALVSFAQILKSTFRDSDVLGRLGGDEFGVLVINAPVTEVDIALQRLQSTIADHNRQERRGYELAYSAGVVEFNAADHNDFSELMAAADARMYETKKEKRRGDKPDCSGSAAA